MTRNKLRIEEVENGYIITATAGERLVSRHIETTPATVGRRVSDLLAEMKERSDGRAKEQPR